MKITRHTAGGYCPCSTAGTAIPDPLQLEQGADVHLGWGQDRSLPACPCSSWATVSSAECSKRVSWLLPLWFIVSVRERGAPASQGTVWEHRGQAGLGTAGSGGAFICSFPKLGWEQEPVPLLVMVHSLWVRSFGEWQGLDVLAPLVYQGLGVGLS